MSAISSIIAMAIDNHKGMVILRSIQFMDPIYYVRTRTHDTYDIVDSLSDLSKTILISNIRYFINEILSDMRMSIGRYRTENNSF